MNKPTRKILDYQIKPQRAGNFKIIEFSQMSNESVIRKRTIHKNKDLSTAEDIVYRLELKLKK